MRIGRSVGAVLVGIVAGIVLSIGTDMLMHVTGIFPPFGQPMSELLFLLATVYRTVYSVAGAFLTARLAPNRPMTHVMVLGALGLVACIVGLVATWNKGPEFGPKWYPLALVVLAIPCVLFGGKVAQHATASD